MNLVRVVATRKLARISSLNSASRRSHRCSRSATLSTARLRTSLAGFRNSRVSAESRNRSAGRMPQHGFDACRPTALEVLAAREDVRSRNRSKPVRWCQHRFDASRNRSSSCVALRSVYPKQGDAALPQRWRLELGEFEVRSCHFTHVNSACIPQMTNGASLVRNQHPARSRTIQSLENPCP